MSVTEILVVIGGLALGYWVVTRLIDDLHRDEKHPLGEHAPVQEPRDGEGDPAAPWHEVLKVSPQATVEEIRQSYQSLMQQYHPDKVASFGDDLKILAERKSRDINAAYARAMQARGGATY